MASRGERWLPPREEKPRPSQNRARTGHPRLDFALPGLPASERVIVPLDAGCCAFAGDRGFLVPELTASATRLEAAEVKATEAGANPELPAYGNSGSGALPSEQLKV